MVVEGLKIFLFLLNSHFSSFSLFTIQIAISKITPGFNPFSKKNGAHFAAEEGGREAEGEKRREEGERGRKRKEESRVERRKKKKKENKGWLCEKRERRREQGEE